jgi:hypothetical protein
VTPPQFKGNTRAWVKQLLTTQLKKEDRESIYKDITRTLPDHTFFSDSEGAGQKALFGVLKCVALLNPANGYVQGMGFICATLMTYTTA